MERPTINLTQDEAMRRFTAPIPIFALAALSICATADAEAAKPKDITSTASYKMSVSLFKELTAHRDIVMLGDSLTARGAWTELTQSSSIANRGIGGDTTAGILSRLDPIILMKPKAIFIMAGINDLGRNIPPSEITTNYIAIIERLSTPNQKIYIQSTLYTSRKSRLANNDLITIINTQMSSYCQTSEKCEYIDLNKTMSSNKKINKQNTGDGIHLTGNGYITWSKAIAPYIPDKR
ncbi:GDSL-type esterase/lipase family protein [Pseudomonas taetrolens]|uniref:GDSL-type esterase/lipase family protein n=1 Tax=Pseudomonas taetrolens TaxID=47884 RepID=UPI0030DB40D6